MTFAPYSLVELQTYWRSNGGAGLGIVGDAGHIAKGVSYHLGRDQLLPTAYSIQTIRDRMGLTNAASAIDLGKLNGSYPQLRTFSDWLARRCLAKAPGTIDVREVIYSPDGKRVLGFKDGVDFLVPDYGDDTHLTHTHISFYRDSEARTKLPLFTPYFVEDDVLDFEWVSGQPDSGPGTVTIQGADHSAILADGTLLPLPEGITKHSYGLIRFTDGKWTGLYAYAIGQDCAWLLKKDVTYKVDPDAGDKVHTVALTVDGVKKAEVKV